MGEKYPKKNAAHSFYVALESQGSPGLFQANPTLAAGDVKVSIDGQALTNLTTLPVVTPAGSKWVLVSLTAGEMNGDDVVVQFSDAAGAEWYDLGYPMQPQTRAPSDLAFPVTSGRGMVVDAAGLVDANVVKTGPTGAGATQTARDLGATLGVAGAGLTALGDTRIANLDAAITTRGTGTALDAAGVRAAIGLTTANTDTQLAAIAALIAAAPAVVGALTVSELASLPGASPTLLQAIARLYMEARNRVDVTATAKRVYTDAGVLLGTKVLSDDGTTYSEAKVA